MLQRIVVVISLMVLLTFAIQGCAPGTYFAMQTQHVAGRPYLLLESFTSSEGVETSFNIYTPKADNGEQWESVSSDRLGRAYGMFVLEPRAPAKDAASIEGPPTPESAHPATGPRLGVFHHKRVTLFDVSKSPPTYTFETLPFDWIAETAVTQQGITYAFGVKLPEYDPLAKDTMIEAPLQVARYDGRSWEDLRVSGPNVRFNIRTGFSLQAVDVQGAIKVLWRNAENDHSLHPNIEGPRLATDGPLMIASFDGQKFSADPITVPGLPRGNLTAWAETNHIGVLIQARAKKEEGISANGPLELWSVTLDGKPQRLETVEKSRAKAGLLSFIAAEQFSSNGQRCIIRSNWQMFEIWRKTAEGEWLVVRNPRGLPAYDLETKLLGILGLCVALVAFGAGLAYHRRKHALTLARKINAHELYATLGLRMGAYGIDLALTLAMTFFLGRQLDWEYVAPFAMMDINFERAPYWPYFLIYMLYTVIFEWQLGTTPGKFIMGLTVVMDGGAKLTLWAALVRNAVGFYERLPHTFLFIAVPMIMFGPRRQRFGDLVSRTFVVQRGALEVFKRQRAADLAARERAAELSGPSETESKPAGAVDGFILPPVDAWNPNKQPRDKETASSDKNDKGSRS